MLIYVFKIIDLFFRLMNDFDVTAIFQVIILSA